MNGKSNSSYEDRIDDPPPPYPGITPDEFANKQKVLPMGPDDIQVTLDYVDENVFEYSESENSESIDYQISRQHYQVRTYSRI